MEIPFYQIDAFTSRRFAGNPAGVCLLADWPDEAVMQAIAAENNLPETAFLVRGAGGYGLRWFTPTVEVDLCGHATLASAFAIFTYVDPALGTVGFDTRSGRLAVHRDGDRLVLDFPATRALPCNAPAGLADALGEAPTAVLRSRDLVAVFETEKQIRDLEPDMARVAALDCFAVIATAPGAACDYVARFFAPRQGIPEDPATGSAHCTLVPYWSHRLGKSALHARQLSPRGGEFFLRDGGERVAIAGHAVTYLSGTLHV